MDVRSMNGRSSSLSNKEQQTRNQTLLKTADKAVRFQLDTLDMSVMGVHPVTASCCHLHHGKEGLSQLSLFIY